MSILDCRSIAIEIEGGHGATYNNTRRIKESKARKNTFDQ